MKPAREPAPSRPKPCASLKKPHESCPFAAPCGRRRKKNDRGQRSAFPSETSRFALPILAHRGSALPWLVNDRAALRLRRTKVNGSHHGDNLLLRPTGNQIATKSYATLQAMAPTNIKTVYQTSLLHISRVASIDSDCCRLPTTSVLSSKPDTNQF